MGTIIKDTDLMNRPMTVLEKAERVSYVYLRNNDPCITQITYRYHNKKYTFYISRIEVDQEE